MNYNNNSINFNDENETIGDHIVLDFTNCNHWHKIHTVLKEAFDFPDYYGENWSALWDCLRELFFFDETPRTVEIYGISSLNEEYQNYCKTMLEIFDEAQKEFPHMTIKHIY
ncbi:MAG: barstar family protein [Clostridia bacterium]|nr:barstar family protein [Clostridia bacterium]